MMRSLPLLLLAGVFAASCAAHDYRQTIHKELPAWHRLTAPYSEDIPSGLFHLSCTDKNPDGSSHYDGLYRDKLEYGRVDLAVRYFQHAAMASNSYRDPLTKPRFKLPGWEVVNFMSLHSGLAYEIYRRVPNIDDNVEFVIAFRGTENSREDWVANFSLIEPQQFKDAVELLKDIRAKDKAARITVAGHSLGGAIALNLSLRFDGVDAVAFNPSPRAFFGKVGNFDNTRVVLYEYGEILNIIGGKYLSSRLPVNVHYGNYNFMDYLFWTFSPAPEHGIYEFARALTLVAISAKSPEALLFFRSNVDIDDAREHWRYCAYLYAQN